MADYWDHDQSNELEDGVNSEDASEVGTKRAIYLQYHKDYAADPREHGTSGLWNHNDRCPSAPWNKKIKKPKDQSGILDLSAKQKDGSCSIVGIKSKTLDIQLLRESLSKMHIVDELPFNFVEGKGFREFVRVLESRFIIPRRDTLASDCFRLYDKEKLIMKTLLKDQRMCLTTDGFDCSSHLLHFLGKLS
ncbi:hypothetical protein LIER_39925 [Lithospermum erythrorhizon]|uniref:Uncharacterized protein n=1 Tax=Lithospermum erythrorhizon TaxID=34254 RepID=A0AAV3QM56_LITER